MVAALTALACGDLGPPGGETVPTADLLLLPLAAGAPAPASASFWVRNDRLRERQLTHPDDFNTPYLELSVPPGTLASLDGVPLAVGDSVLVAVQPWPGAYGLTLSPAGLAFTLDATPTVTFFYGVYGDLGVADGSPHYATRADYAAALGLWYEVTPGRWRATRSSGPAGADAVGGPIDNPGTYVLAALR